MPTEQTLVHFGGAIKALDDSGRVGGYLVTFSDSKRKDLDGDYFDAKSYLGARDADGVDCLFHHGIPLKSGLEDLADHVFKPVKTKRDAIGIFAETVLDLSDAYEAKVHELAKAGKVGWSSGSASHTVKRLDDGYLKRWLIVEASLTPTPAQPFVNKIMPLKTAMSLQLEPAEDEDETLPLQPIKVPLAAKLNLHVDDLVDGGRTRASIIERLAAEAGIETKAVEAALAGEIRPADAKLKAFARVLDVSFDSLKAAAGRDITIKGMFDEALEGKEASQWLLWDTFGSVAAKLATVKASTTATGVQFDLPAKLDEATGEYVARLKMAVLSQIEDYVLAGSDEPFHIKSFHNPEANPIGNLSGVDLDDHSLLLVSGLRGIAARFRDNHESRIKAGRTLSEKNRQRIATLQAQLTDVHKALQSLLDESMPMASDEEKRAAMSQALRLRARTRQLGAVNG